MVEPKFGQRVFVRATLVRATEPSGNHFLKFWKKTPLAKTKTGIFLGTRILQDGRLVNTGHWGTEFEVLHYYKGALVCLSPNQNPVYARLEDISV
jgi:hypothetical protein